MKPSSQPSDDNRALQDALAEITRTPRNAEQERLHKQATDMRDPEAVQGLRNLVHGDFARLGEEKVAGQSEAGLSPEQKQEQWLGAFRERFNRLSALHEGITFTDVEKSLKADPESMRRVQALDEKGHEMNVFGFDKENNEFIFASAWNNYESIAADHRTITYDPAGQKLAKDNGYHPNGNAISIIAKIMGCEEKDAGKYLANRELHNQLRAALGNDINGWAWLQTDDARRKTGYALYGHNGGVGLNVAYGHGGLGSFRAALRVKRV